MKYLFPFILCIGCTPSNEKDSGDVQRDDGTTPSTEEPIDDSSDTAVPEENEPSEEEDQFPISHFESTSTTYDSQYPELSLSLNGSVLSVGHGIFNAESAHDFDANMSVTLDNSIIVVNYGLIDVPFGSGTATWYDLSYDVDISSLELGTYRFRIVLDYDIADQQDTSVFLENDIVYE